MHYQPTNPYWGEEEESLASRSVIKGKGGVHP